MKQWLNRLLRRGSATPPSRRAVAAQRQAQLQADEQQLAPATAYRRNRTLNSRQADSPAEISERQVAHQAADGRRRRWRWLTGGAVAVALVLLLSWYCLLAVQVRTPDTASASHAAHYQQLLDDYYRAHPVERFLPLLNHQALQADFLKKVPEVKTVQVEPEVPTRGVLKLTFRQPVAQWMSGEKTYFVDSQGITFEQNYFAAPSITVKDESGLPADGGQEVINRQFLRFLGQTVAQFGQHNLLVTEAILPAETIRQMAFQLQDKPYRIKMTIDRESQAQVQQAVLAIRHLESTGQTPSYIDVRVDQRVFYK